MHVPKVKKRDLSCLRQQIAKIEKRQVFCFEESSKHKENVSSFRDNNKNNSPDIAAYSFGDTAIDDVLGGGLPFAALTEFRCDETRVAGPASSFAWILARRVQAILTQSRGKMPIIWIGETYTRLEGGELYPPGLCNLGIDPSQCLFIQPRSLNDALWAAEICAKETAISAIILEIRGNPAQLDMAGTRRLHLRAQASGRPVFIVKQSGQAEATAARIRFHIEPASASFKTLPSHQIFEQSIHYPAFRITIEKSQNPAPHTFIMEWNHDTQLFSISPEGNASSKNYNTDIDVHKNRSKNSGADISLSVNGQNKTHESGRILAFG